MRLKSKEDRLKMLEYDFNRLKEKGANRENYKDLVIFTWEDEKPYLKIYCGTSTKPLVFGWCRNNESRQQRIDELKKTADYRADRKKEKKPLTDSASAAKEIREELKKVFPGVKFSVRSENFSMGDAVRVSWDDGPTETQVKEVTRNYQYGHFDGMTDMYENSNTRDDISQAKYITLSRHQSNESEQALNSDEVNQVIENWSNERPETLRYQLYESCSIPVGAFINGIEKKPDTSHGHGICAAYRLTLDTTNAKNIKPVTRPEKVETTPGEVQIIEYSEKAIAVIGDTKPIKDKLGRDGLNGRFNARLSCGPGWIFPKGRLAEVEAALTA